VNSGPLPSLVGLAPLVPFVFLLFGTMEILRETLLNGTHHRVDSYRYGSFSFANEEEDPYFVTNAKPEGLDIVKKTADEFIKFQCAQKRPVVLVTSGGSTVPLEVRVLALSFLVFEDLEC
jgi:hypothetical protein